MSLEVKIMPVDTEWTAKVAVEGRLDANTSADFEKTMNSVLSAPIDYLILDMAKLSYISSAGIRALIYINKKMAESEGRVFCTNLQPQIAQVMEAIKALPGLDVFKNDQEMDEYLTAIQEEVLRKAKKH